MAPTLLQLGYVPDKMALPTCTPYLMPFHIDYSGHAPVSTYLRVQAASETVGAPPSLPEHASSGDIKAGESSQASEKPEDAIVNGTVLLETDTAKNAQAVSTPTLAKRVTDATNRFISSFRGRTIHGLKVHLPEGYGGLVLRADAVGNGTKMDTDKSNKVRGKAKGKQKAGCVSKGRITRSAARVEAGDDDAMDVDEDEMNLKDGVGPGGTVRTLVPSSQFSTFVLWHPDNPVDETRDEYFRSLKEWTRLAHEIHKTEA